MSNGIGQGGTVGRHGIGAPLAVLQVGVGSGLSTCPLTGLIADEPMTEKKNATSRIAKSRLRFDCIVFAPLTLPSLSTLPCLPCLPPMRARWAKYPI